MSDYGHRIEGDLEFMFCEHIWGYPVPLRLAGDQFEVLGSDEYPDADEDAVILRRKSDDAVFEADIVVIVRAHAPRKDDAS